MAISESLPIILVSQKSIKHKGPVDLYSLGSYYKRWKYEIKNAAITTLSRKKSKILEIGPNCVLLFCSDTRDIHLLGMNSVLYLFAEWLSANRFTSLWNLVYLFMQLNCEKQPLYKVVMTIKAICVSNLTLTPALSRLVAPPRTAPTDSFTTTVSTTTIYISTS